MPFLAFLLLCFCWGSTFVPLKEGLTTLPPLLFAGSRFVLAACVFGTATLINSKHRVLPRGQKIGNEPEQFLGIAAIAFGGVCYALDSLLVRPLLKTFDPVTVTTVQVSVGGVTLLPLRRRPRRTQVTPGGQGGI